MMFITPIPATSSATPPIAVSPYPTTSIVFSNAPRNASASCTSYCASGPWMWRSERRTAARTDSSVAPFFGYTSSESTGPGSISLSVEYGISI